MRDQAVELLCAGIGVHTIGYFNPCFGVEGRGSIVSLRHPALPGESLQPIRQTHRSRGGAGH